ncbi:hypothetical protein DL89DRAFT_53444 [Linderina pennispora]|uniref:Uncharacterized protein n=1 Tax=Linderina pennispora TaxID=61395 RepID=A0A1Y1W220_9FUNG|nr:uncharacterized protein DL89DRAFT_53444 [Linderina pennispora]ORX67164.1 hypothetical protein DL89DRAFT_53444 [Linderina pennispora]
MCLSAVARRRSAFLGTADPGCCCWVEPPSRPRSRGPRLRLVSASWLRHATDRLPRWLAGGSAAPQSAAADKGSSAGRFSARQAAGSLRGPVSGSANGVAASHRPESGCWLPFPTDANPPSSVSPAAIFALSAQFFYGQAGTVNPDFYINRGQSLATIFPSCRTSPLIHPFLPHPLPLCIFPNGAFHRHCSLGTAAAPPRQAAVVDTSIAGVLLDGQQLL